MPAGRAARRWTGWAAVAGLYAALLAVAPTLGARVGHAAAVAEAEGALAGLALLDSIGSAESYQPWWAVRAHLLARLGRHGAARSAYAQAALLAHDPAVRTFLRARAGAGM